MLSPSGDGVDRVHGGPEPTQQLGRELGCRPVRAVDDDAPCRRGDASAAFTRWSRYRSRASPAGRIEPGSEAASSGWVRKASISSSSSIRQLHARVGEELDPVVLGRVVGRRDHHAGGCPGVDREERDRGRRLHPREDHVAARRTDAVRRGRPRATPRMRGDRGRRRASAAPCAVPAEHDDGGPSQAVRELGRELAAREAADAVGAEEPSHGREGYPSGAGPGPARCPRMCGSIRGWTRT